MLQTQQTDVFRRIMLLWSCGRCERLTLVTLDCCRLWRRSCWECSPVCSWRDAARSTSPCSRWNSRWRHQHEAAQHHAHYQPLIQEKCIALLYTLALSIDTKLRNSLANDSRFDLLQLSHRNVLQNFKKAQFTNRVKHESYKNVLTTASKAINYIPHIQ